MDSVVKKTNLAVRTTHSLAPAMEVEASDAEKKEIRMIFNLFDQNRDGHIDLEEMGFVLRSMGFRLTENQVGDIFKEADTNQDGKIDLEEFTHMITRMEMFDESDLADPEKRKREANDAEKVKQPATKRRKKEVKPTKKDKGKGKMEVEEKTTTKERKVENKVATAVRRKRAGRGVLKLDGGSKTITLQRELSISDFYTSFAGQHEEINCLNMDKFANPSGRIYDLGHEGAFGRFSVIVGLFCKDHMLIPKHFMTNAGKALQEKGFRVKVETSRVDFANDLCNHDVGWIVSDRYPSPEKELELLFGACKRFHENGGGLAFWADNTPWLQTLNEILKPLKGFEVEGKTQGSKKMEISPNFVTNKYSPENTGKFAKHLLTSGIVTLFEGVTISVPTKESENVFEHIAVSSDGHPCILVQDYNILPPTAGRILVDCGFTKLYVDWNTAGTERYVRNVCVWLLGLDHRMKIGAPLQGPMKFVF